MASPARILSLNLGTQTVGLAEFHKADNGGLVLNAYKQSEILADPSAESTRLPQTRLAIAGLREDLKLKGGRINYAITAQNIFARFVKLPPVAEDKVDQIIGFEAQQNVPFPIEEVVWDYQLVSSGREEQIEVVLVAIKSDLLDDLNDTAQSAGFRTQVVDASPLALYNAFRYNYSDLSGTSLLIDLGARTTNLIFVDANRVFSRSILIGGNTITSNLAKEFQESFAAAEERKRRDGYVGLGGAYADDKNPDIAKAAKNIRTTMTRLHAEISRSITFYRAQQGGAQPQRIFLCGGTANLAYLREFFSEKFQVPVEFFNPLRNVTLTQNVSMEEVAHNAHTMGELVGLGLRGVNTCPMELNLRPASVVRAQKIAARQPYFVMAGACVLLALAGWWLYFMRAAGIQSSVLGGTISQQVSTMQNIEGKMNTMDKEIAQIGTTSEPLTQTIDARQYWTSVISEINYHQPPKYVWVTLLEPTSNGNVVQFDDPNKAPAATATSGSSSAAAKPGAKVTKPAIDGIHIKGLYLYNPDSDRIVETFVTNLSKANGAFKINTNRLNDVIKNRAQQDEKSWAFPYELQIPLAKPLPLE